MKSITVLRDNKEKIPWDFSIYGFAEKKIHLKTGDYTVEGLEDIICIERKRNTGEISLNLGRLSKQFKAEFERMEQFRFRYLICEFSADSLAKFPQGSGIPKRMWKKLRMNGKFMIKRLNEWCEQYGVELIFCNTKLDAEQEAAHIIKEVIEITESEKTETVENRDRADTE
jgi:hypothetical protein